MEVGQNVIGNYYLSWGNYNERDLCVRSEISLMGGWICGGRLLWKRFLLWPFSALPLPPPPAIEPFSFRISTLTLSVSCDHHFAKTHVSVHPATKSTASIITSVENVQK